MAINWRAVQWALAYDASLVENGGEWSGGSEPLFITGLFASLYFSISVLRALIGRYVGLTRRPARRCALAAGLGVRRHGDAGEPDWNAAPRDNAEHAGRPVRIPERAEKHRPAAQRAEGHGVRDKRPAHEERLPLSHARSRHSCREDRPGERQHISLALVANDERAKRLVENAAPHFERCAAVWGPIHVRYMTDRCSTRLWTGGRVRLGGSETCSYQGS
jgi:hypothetical protein